MSKIRDMFTDHHSSISDNSYVVSSSSSDTGFVVSSPPAAFSTHNRPCRMPSPEITQIPDDENVLRIYKGSLMRETSRELVYQRTRLDVNRIQSVAMYQKSLVDTKDQNIERLDLVRTVRWET
jgi:hypothetical protein